MPCGRGRGCRFLIVGLAFLVADEVLEQGWPCSGRSRSRGSATCWGAVLLAPKV